MDREISFKDFTLIRNEIERVVRIQDTEARKKQLSIALFDMIEKGYHDVPAIAYGFLSEDRELSRIVRVVAIRLRISEAIYRFSRLDKDLADLCKNMEQMYTREFIEDNKRDDLSVEEVERMWLFIAEKDSTSTFILIKNKIKEMRQIRNGKFYA
jgi:hypothetical protein